MQEPSLLADKSALQSLTEEECRWLNHFFRAVITPVIMVETLGNLQKDWRDGRSAEQFLASMARKIRGYFSYPNVEADELILGEFAGYPVEMRGRPCVGGGQMFTDSTGKKGIFFEQSPEERDLHRWSDQDFTDAERELAIAWQETLRQLQVAHGRTTKQPSSLKTLDAAAEAVDNFLTAEGHQWRLLCLAFEMFKLAPAERRLVGERWKMSGRPAVKDFAPYACFVLKCNLLVDVAQDAGFLPDRPTNAIDLLYLHYLPFCQVFVSGDKLHKRLAPYLLRPDQTFVPVEPLKTALQELSRYYAELPDSTRSTGMVNYARFLPLELDTALHEAFDVVNPRWRDEARSPPPPPMTEEAKSRLLEHVRPMREAIERASSATRRLHG